jgi:hypothetical protein
MHVKCVALLLAQSKCTESVSDCLLFLKMTRNYHASEFIPLDSFMSQAQSKKKKLPNSLL